MRGTFSQRVRGSSNYFAGGCFWGMEQLMQSIPGVIDAESGYANGTCKEDADYKTVCKGYSMLSEYFLNIL